ncbi:hypothetical protein ACWXVV_02275 [Mycoplasma sp. 3392]
MTKSKKVAVITGLLSTTAVGISLAFLSASCGASQELKDLGTKLFEAQKLYDDNSAFAEDLKDFKKAIDDAKSISNKASSEELVAKTKELEAAIEKAKAIIAQKTSEASAMVQEYKKLVDSSKELLNNLKAKSLSATDFEKAITDSVAKTQDQDENGKTKDKVDTDSAWREQYAALTEAKAKANKLYQVVVYKELDKEVKGYLEGLNKSSYENIKSTLQAVKDEQGKVVEGAKESEDAKVVEAYNKLSEAYNKAKEDQKIIDKQDEILAKKDAITSLATTADTQAQTFKNAKESPRYDEIAETLSQAVTTATSYVESIGDVRTLVDNTALDAKLQEVSNQYDTLVAALNNAKLDAVKADYKVAQTAANDLLSTKLNDVDTDENILDSKRALVSSYKQQLQSKLSETDATVSTAQANQSGFGAVRKAAIELQKLVDSVDKNYTLQEFLKTRKDVEDRKAQLTEEASKVIVNQANYTVWEEKGLPADVDRDTTIDRVNRNQIQSQIDYLSWRMKEAVATDELKAYKDLKKVVEQWLAQDKSKNNNTITDYSQDLTDKKAVLDGRVNEIYEAIKASKDVEQSTDKPNTIKDATDALQKALDDAKVAKNLYPYTQAVKAANAFMDENKDYPTALDGLKKALVSAKSKLYDENDKLKDSYESQVNPAAQEIPEAIEKAKIEVAKAKWQKALADLSVLQCKIEAWNGKYGQYSSATSSDTNVNYDVQKDLKDTFDENKTAANPETVADYETKAKALNDAIAKNIPLFIDNANNYMLTKAREYYAKKETVATRSLARFNDEDKKVIQERIDLYRQYVDEKSVASKNKNNNITLKKYRSVEEGEKVANEIIALGDDLEIFVFAHKLQTQMNDLKALVNKAYIWSNKSINVQSDVADDYKSNLTIVKNNVLETNKPVTADSEYVLENLDAEELFKRISENVDGYSTIKQELETRINDFLNVLSNKIDAPVVAPTTNETEGTTESSDTQAQPEGSTYPSLRYKVIDLVGGSAAALRGIKDSFEKARKDKALIDCQNLIVETKAIYAENRDVADFVFAPYWKISIKESVDRVESYITDNSYKTWSWDQWKQILLSMYSTRNVAQRAVPFVELKKIYDKWTANDGKFFNDTLSEDDSVKAKVMTWGIEKYQEVQKHMFHTDLLKNGVDQTLADILAKVKAMNNSLVNYQSMYDDVMTEIVKAKKTDARLSRYPEAIAILDKAITDAKALAEPEQPIVEDKLNEKNIQDAIVVLRKAIDDAKEVAALAEAKEKYFTDKDDVFNLINSLPDDQNTKLIKIKYQAEFNEIVKDDQLFTTSQQFKEHDDMLLALQVKASQNIVVKASEALKEIKSIIDDKLLDSTNGYQQDMQFTPFYGETLKAFVTNTLEPEFVKNASYQAQADVDPVRELISTGVLNSVVDMYVNLYAWGQSSEYNYWLAKTDKVELLNNSVVLEGGQKGVLSAFIENYYKPTEDKSRIFAKLSSDMAKYFSNQQFYNATKYWLLDNGNSARTKATSATRIKYSMISQGYIKLLQIKYDIMDKFMAYGDATRHVNLSLKQTLTDEQIRDIAAYRALSADFVARSKTEANFDISSLENIEKMYDFLNGKQVPQINQDASQSNPSEESVQN